MAHIPAHTLLVRLGLAVALAVTPAGVYADSIDSFDELATILKRGDSLELTDMSGRRMRGHLVEVSACSIVLATSMSPRATISRDAVKKLRLLRIATLKSVGDGIGLAAKRCNDAACAPVALAIVGGAGVARVVGALFRPSRILYRAPTRNPMERCR